MRSVAPQSGWPLAPAPFFLRYAVMVAARRRESPCRASAEPRQVVTHLALKASASSLVMSIGPFEADGDSCARAGPLAPNAPSANAQIASAAPTAAPPFVTRPVLTPALTVWELNTYRPFSTA